MKVYGELVRAQIEILQSDPAAGIEGRIWFNDVSNYVKVDLDGTNIAVLFNSQQQLLPANTAIDIGDNTGSRFQGIYSQYAGIGGQSNAAAILAVGVSQTVTLSGDTQTSVLGRITGNTASTAGIIGFSAGPTTAAASWTSAFRIGFSNQNISKGASSTITRDIAFGGTIPDQGTFNAFIADNTAYTANYFINSTSTSPSLFSGTVTFANIIDSGLTATTVPYVNSAKQFTSSAVTPTELGYVAGVTSAIQSQLNALSTVALVTKNASAADYTILDADGYGTILLATSSSDRTVTLPSAASNSSRKITLKKIDSAIHKVTVTGTIDGVSNFILMDQDDYVTVQSDGTSWYILEKGIGSRVVSRVWDNVGAGVGSTNVFIRRIETSVVNTGGAVTRAVSSTLGNSYTINQGGIYFFKYTDKSSTSSADFAEFGITLNENQMTSADISSVSAADLLVTSDAMTGGSGGKAIATISMTRRLASGDVLRPHCQSNMTFTSDRISFYIEKIGL